MNAQEALENYFIAKKKFDDEVHKSMEVIEDFIDQSNAKPKTLEELGWEANQFADDDVCYSKRSESGEVELSIEITPTHCLTDALIVAIYKKLAPILTKDEILAIAEKMKEFGMTSAIAKGETK